MNLELYIDRIEQYETGVLTEPERAEFELELASSAELRQALALYREANAVIEQGIENQLRSQLQGWADEAEPAAAAPGPSGGRVVSMGWIRWAAAASVLFLLGWLGVRWAGTTYSDETLFAAAYEKPADSAFRAGGSETHPLQPGFDAWQGGNYTGAITFFKTIPESNERYTEAQYYLGHAALSARQFDLAIAAFQQTAQRDEPKFREKADWNLVLAYLAAGRDGDSVFEPLLSEIANAPDHSYQAQAKALQNKLASPWRRFAK